MGKKKKPAKLSTNAPPNSITSPVSPSPLKIRRKEVIRNPPDVTNEDESSKQSVDEIDKLDLEIKKEEPVKSIQKISSIAKALTNKLTEQQNMSLITLNTIAGTIDTPSKSDALTERISLKECLAQIQVC